MTSYSRPRILPASRPIIHSDHSFVDIEASSRNSSDDYAPLPTSFNIAHIPSLASTYKPSCPSVPIDHIISPAVQQAMAGQKKKYKPVALKVRPVKTELPKQFRIVRNIVGDPLADMPRIDLAHLVDYSPTGRYTQERMQAFHERHADFLLPEEQRLLHNFMMLNNAAFAWDDSERGRFRQDFFPPISMAVIPHIPWVEKNIPIPRGLYDEICRIVRDKIAAGVYEPSICWTFNFHPTSPLR